MLTVEAPHAACERVDINLYYIFLKYVFAVKL